jgi:hypothetical protein
LLWNCFKNHFFLHKTCGKKQKREIEEKKRKEKKTKQNKGKEKKRKEKKRKKSLALRCAIVLLQ